MLGGGIGGWRDEALTLPWGGERKPTRPDGRGDGGSLPDVVPPLRSLHALHPTLGLVIPHTTVPNLADHRWGSGRNIGAVVKRLRIRAIEEE